MAEKNVHKSKAIANNSLTAKLAIDSDIINRLILFALAVIPLLIHLKPQYLISPNIDPLIYITTGNVVNFFTYYKFVFLIGITAIITVIFIFKIWTYRGVAKVNSINFYLLAFILSLMISVLLANYKSIALWGNYSRNGGFLTYSCLTLLMLVIVNLKFKENLYKKILYLLYPFAIINGLLALLHFFGFNVLNNNMVKFFIFGKYADIGLKETSYIVGTIGHYNYTSALGAIIFAVFFAKVLFSSKERLEKHVNFFMTILGATIVFCSGSLNGVVTLVFILIFLIGVTVERKSKEEIFILSAIVLLSGIEFYLLSRYDSKLLQDVLSNLMIIILSCLAGIFAFLMYFHFKYKARLTMKKGIAILAVLVVLVIGLSQVAGNQIVNKMQAEFNKMDSKTIYERLMQDDFALPEESWTIGTGRLYIWKQTLKLAAEKPLFGHGLDTLACVLDQGDPAKISSMTEPDVIIDKPHNIYLSILYGSGIFALLLYLLIIGQVLFRGFGMILKKEPYYELQWPLLFGIMAYVFQGMFNDSVIGLQIVFWIFMGYSYLLSNREEKSYAKKQ